MNPHVRSVRPLDEYQLEVLFENGECRRFDVRPYLDRGIFTRLRDPTLFRAVRIVAGSVEWPGGLDLSYDTLFVEGHPSVVQMSGTDQEVSAGPGRPA